MQPKVEPPPSTESTSGMRPTRVRHVVLGLTVAAYMITYMDRQILAVARPTIMKELGISLVMMGWITFSFRLAYALFQIPGGWLGDRFGARRALTVVVTWWSVFTGLTALAWNAVYRSTATMALPTTTIATGTLYLGFIYNSTDTVWELVARA